METLPIYRLRRARADSQAAVEMAGSLYGGEDFAVHNVRGRTVVRCRDRAIEFDGSGSWAADHGRLWRMAEQIQLPDEAKAAGIADEYVRRNRLAPKLPKDFRFARTSSGGSFASVKTSGKRRDQRLDLKANYSVRVVLDEPVGGISELPIIGGGGKTTVTIGNRGDVVGHLSAWREIESAFTAGVVPRERADEQFRELTRALKITNVEVGLAYFSAPIFADQEFLYPVYTYKAMVANGERRVPARVISLPATTFGPCPTPSKPQPPRARPRLPFNLGPRRSYATAAINPFEVGTSWIGQLGGLGGSQGNAQGFVDEMSADGWLINFNWGDANAWESDWRRNDDYWVDAADFVFYTGHASGDGWMLASPDDGSLDFTEVGTLPQAPGDLWGQNDLEWIVVAACGPLEDDILAEGGGDVFDRWDGAFDGLHSLMGYGAITFDNTEEGRRIAQYAKDGMPVIDAWLRTGQEIQPSDNGCAAPFGPTVWVGAMYVIGAAGTDPRMDRIWGHGSVSGDPRNPSTYVALWTSC